MAKTKTTTETVSPVNSNEPWTGNFAGFIKTVVGQIGSKAGKENVLSKIRELHGESAVTFVTGKGNALSTAINTANKSHGYVVGSTKKSTPTFQPITAEDIRKTLDVVNILEEKPTKVLTLVRELRNVGDLNRFEQCLDMACVGMSYSTPNTNTPTTPNTNSM